MKCSLEINNIPTIFINSGNQYYLNITIQQAKRYNKNVILLGDDTNKHIDVNHFMAKEYYISASKFKQIYKSMTCNPENFELLCFQRWYILNEFMNKNKIDCAFYLDSDVMLYCDVSNMFKNITSFSIPKNQPNVRYCANAGASYWLKDDLDNFCNYMTDTYLGNNEYKKLEEKWQYHLNHGRNGAVCDMTLLYFYAKKYNITSITEIIDNSTFDHNIIISENLYPNEYRMNENIKEIKWIDNKPYCYNLIQNKWIKFNAIHLSSARQYIENFIKYETT